MTFLGWLQILVYFVIISLALKPLGSYMAHVFQGEPTFLTPILSLPERTIFRLAGIKKEEEMNWKEYAISLLLFSFAGILLLFLIQRTQAFLPLNPNHMPNVRADTALNTAISFVTNTNWQNYGGETTLSFFTQMMGLTVQNFVSAAAGMSVLMALIRAFARRNTTFLGNFWADVTRSTLYILLPLAVILSLLLVSQGTIQTFSPAIQADLIQPFIHKEGVSVTQQTLAMGPVASQTAIKHLGTNGGGFFNANAAHPFENPNGFTNLLLILGQTIIPISLTYTFGKMVGDLRQGRTLLLTMVLLLFTFIALTYAAESAGNPLFTRLGSDQTASAIQPGGNMEGKEVRLGIAQSSIFAITTTGTSTGAVDSMHDSYTPLGGFMLLLMMQLGEVIPGGDGSGLYGLLVFVIIAVFVAGLMVGRTPEYLGKKIEPFEMKMAALLILIMPIAVLGLTGIALVTPAGQAGISNPGPHGFSQVLYAFTSQANNNGSGFAGLSGNTLFYNLLGGLAMLIGRFWLAIPTLALAGAIAEKKKSAAGAGTLSTTSPLFIGWLIAIILIVGALNFIPALALGPVIEHLMMAGI